MSEHEPIGANLDQTGEEFKDYPLPPQLSKESPYEFRCRKIKEVGDEAMKGKPLIVNNFVQPSKEGWEKRLWDQFIAKDNGKIIVQSGIQEAYFDDLKSFIQSLLKEEHDRWWYAAQYSIEKKDDLDRLGRAYQALTYNIT